MVSSAAASNAGGQASRPLRRLFFGLQFKFTLLVLSLTLSVAAMVGAVLVDLVGEFAQGQERRQCVQLANLLAHSSARVLESGDHQALQDLAQQYSTSQPVLFVTFTDAAGQQLASASRAHTEGASYRECQPLPNHSGLIGQAVLVPRQAGCPIHLVTTFPINRPQRQSSDERVLIGYVQIGYDIEHTLADLAAAFDLLSGWTIAVLILTVPLAYLVVRFVVVPLNELSQVVRRFAHGNLQARTTVHSQDEIGDLAKAFNLMADDLANQHQEIIALNTELEQRVQKRTRQLRELASREPLTGLYNRRHFNEVLANRFSEASRYGTDLSCVMLDLDNFKQVNDRFGHQIGDELLILAAITMASQLRAADVAARFGGDEFILLLPQTGADRARILAERIAAKFTQDLAEQLPEVKVTLSIGIASMADASPRSPEELVRASDQAMYQAKAQGKSRIITAAIASS